MVDFFWRLEIFSEVANDGPDRLFIGLISREGLEKKRDSMLIRRNPQYEAFKVPSPVFGISIGDLDLLGTKVRLIVPSDTAVLNKSGVKSTKS